jgi:hypothetical protein
VGKAGLSKLPRAARAGKLFHDESVRWDIIEGMRFLPRDKSGHATNMPF